MNYSTLMQRWSQCWTFWLRKHLIKPEWRFWKSMNSLLLSHNQKNTKSSGTLRYLKRSVWKHVKIELHRKSPVVATSSELVRLSAELLTRSTYVARWAKTSLRIWEKVSFSSSMISLWCRQVPIIKLKNLCYPGSTKKFKWSWIMKNWRVRMHMSWLAQELCRNRSITVWNCLTHVLLKAVQKRSRKRKKSAQSTVSRSVESPANSVKKTRKD